MCELKCIDFVLSKGVTFISSTTLHITVLSCSVTSDSLRLHGLYPASLICSRNFPGNNTAVGCHFLLQGIFLTQGSHQHLFCLQHRWAGSLPSRITKNY